MQLILAVFEQSWDSFVTFHWRIGIITEQCVSSRRTNSGWSMTVNCCLHPVCNCSWTTGVFTCFSHGIVPEWYVIKLQSQTILPIHGLSNHCLHLSPSVLDMTRISVGAPKAKDTFSNIMTCRFHHPHSLHSGIHRNISTWATWTMHCG